MNLSQFQGLPVLAYVQIVKATDEREASVQSLQLIVLSLGNYFMVQGDARTNIVAAFEHGQRDAVALDARYILVRSIIPWPKTINGEMPINKGVITGFSPRWGQDGRAQLVSHMLALVELLSTEANPVAITQFHDTSVKDRYESIVVAIEDKG